MYSRKVEEGNVAKACSQNIRISIKNAKPVCKAVRGLELKRAKKFLEEMLKEKKSINGKYYSKTTQEVLNIISSAEKNAEFKNLDLDKMFILHISALGGTHMRRRRRKSKFGPTIKSTHLEVILKEKGAGNELKTKIEKKVDKEPKKEKSEGVKKESNKTKKAAAEPTQEKSKEKETAKTNKTDETKEKIEKDIKEPDKTEKSEEVKKEVPLEKSKTEKSAKEPKTEKDNKK